jgi:hydrophobic/amphiphilic exporter-1 (mainly G- bacteria), HAE1 family
MGVAVVGGMLTSTFLTLVIVPVVYTAFSDMGAWFHRRKEPSPETVGLQEVTGK